MRVILLSLTFNVFWFAAVVGRSDWIPVLVVLLIGALLIDRSLYWAMPLFAVVGIVGDSVLSHLGILQFPHPHLPLWLCLMWAGFASYLWLLRDWMMSQKTWILLIAGSVGGMLSYLGGERLDAVTFGEPIEKTALILFGMWLMYTVVFLSMLKVLTRKAKSGPDSHSAIPAKK
ncbi:DUF2878 domain-containing protein [Enterovibrio norvegicus]|uniref:DUF2878 domain-containing protein n=1 Tax=Enterovibrio norvegicus TaxID=188144 RepID=UPI000C837270|nr:DUF2878 domain-containing protein [Enterovibrio norvegicus]PMN64403.1 hypothetical protein BCT27_10610 [Enterovibrio norvegicus]